MLCMKSRTMKQKRFYKMLFIFLLGFPCTFAETTEASVRDTTVCDPICGCDGLYIYDSVKEGCVLNLPKLMKRVVVHYDNQKIRYIFKDFCVAANNDPRVKRTKNHPGDDAILKQDGMARSIYIEGQKLFRGIIISVLLFITCASLCILSACIYCCKINYTDRKLKREVEALAKKMHKTNILNKEPKKPTDDPKSQSCNVIVEEAGVFVV